MHVLDEGVRVSGRIGLTKKPSVEDRTADLTPYWTAYRETGDPEALDFLVRRYESLAAYLAKKALAKAPAHQDADDILSFAHGGLLDAIRKFDPDAGVKFETYATRRIAGAIIDEQRRMDPLVRTMRQKVKLIAATTERLWEELNRDPSAEELAEASGLSLTEVREAQASQKTMTAELDATTVDASHQIGDAAADESHIAHMRLRVARRLAAAGGPGHAIALLHYCDERSLTDVARDLGVPLSRARSLQVELLQLLQG